MVTLVFVLRHPEYKPRLQSKSDNIKVGLDQYLHDIGKIQLLSATEEIELAEEVREFMRTLKSAPALAAMSEREPRKFFESGQAAKNRMIVANLRLVISVAKKYYKRQLPFADLVQEGNIGLIRAVEKFNPDLGYRFSTYAYWWIRQAVVRQGAYQGRLLRLPQHVHDKLATLKKIEREFSQKHLRKPTVKELSDEAAISLDDYLFYRWANQPLDSLDRLIDSEPMTELIEKADAVHPVERLYQRQVQEILSTAFTELTDLQREVIVLRFGLSSVGEVSLSKTGQILNISREQVRQIQVKALSLLRKVESIQMLQQ